ncbi:MAG: EamA family transporter [Chloroflexota bacterium]|nr:EamA family transporter [Chloroflexota bacterium]
MNWISTAILAAAIMGMVSILDSHLLSRRMPGLRAFLLPVGIIHLVYGSLLFVFFPLPEGAAAGPVLVAVASAMLRTAAVFIILDSLKREEVSQVIPVVYTYPVFVAVMAGPLLGESLNSLQWLAIAMVVLGAVMSSVEQVPSGSFHWRSRMLILFASSLLLAAADVASKYALASISFWNMCWIGAFCMSGTFLLISVRPHVIRQLINMKQRNSAMRLIALDEVLAPLGILLSFWALERGPVSLVSAILSSRPAFVLMAALILSRLSPVFLLWRSGRAMLILRLIATAMVVGGIAIIYLA